MATNPVKVKCVMCGNIVNYTDTIKNRNPMLPEYGYCKECISKKFSEDKGPRDVLRLINVPYVEKLWNDIVLTNPDKPLGGYLKAIAPKKQYKQFLDSEFVDTSNPDDFKITPKIIDRWGTGYDKRSYEELEVKYASLVKIKPPVTILEENMYRDNVLIEMRLQEALRAGTAGDIEKMRNLYTKDLKNLGLDVIKNNLDEVEALGSRIAKWELTRPLPNMEHEFSDTDRIHGYISKFFLKPLKRAFGVATNKDIEDIYKQDSDIIPRTDIDDSDYDHVDFETGGE
ncbi:TPA: hypothetical protein ACGO1T_000522 [Streptococcus suis]